MPVTIDFYQLGFDSYMHCGYNRSMSEYEYFHSTSQDQDAFNKGQYDAFYVWFNSIVK